MPVDGRDADVKKLGELLLRQPNRFADNTASDGLFAVFS